MGRYNHGGNQNLLFGSVGSYLRRCLFRILSIGPIPDHFAFIMDGNRRYAKKLKLEEGAGHNAGFLSLISLLQYCIELEVKYMTVYAFSIDNFKRNPNQVERLMDLLLEKINWFLKEESIVNQYGVRVYFIGNLKLLSDSVRDAAEKVMNATASNSRLVLSICLAYTSRDEIVHAVEESSMDKSDEKMLQENPEIKLVDVEKNMYMAIAPDPEIMIRSSGETRLSNFLLWQSSNCLLYSPAELWPEIGLWHLVWAVLNFQQNHSYLEKKKQL
ncbi:Alkyl transferase [Melia azedarach]|uniref:Alkyl transferase n=1 Tax=Melia azedarach TaxID=155640 RepID=A0ACC1XRE0_MELAZ|nr:Alkyl transferase [Melia azedarach]